MGSPDFKWSTPADIEDVIRIQSAQEFYDYVDTRASESARQAELRTKNADITNELRDPGEPNERHREKQQKFKILDAPSELEGDLNEPPGVHGRVLIYLDIDRFKSVNEMLTETVADQHVLPLIHRLIDKCSSNNGRAYAEGGDEFIILLPNASLEMGHATAEAVRKKIAALEFAGPARETRLTASFGLAYEPASGDGQGLKLRANEAKRASKDKGRNCVTVWTLPETNVPLGALSRSDDSKILTTIERLSNSALRKRTEELVSRLRDLLEEWEEDEKVLHDIHWSERSNLEDESASTRRFVRHSEELSARHARFRNRVERKYKNEAILLRNEFARRLGIKQLRSEIAFYFDAMVNRHVCGEVANILDMFQRSLPD